MVAGPGIEPGTRAYETLEMPFLYPAIVLFFKHLFKTPPNISWPFFNRKFKHLHWRPRAIDQLQEQSNLLMQLC